MEPKKPLSPLSIWLWSAGICLFQQLFLLGAMVSRGLSPRLGRTIQWDCNWFLLILREGYHTDWPPTMWQPAIANVYFFPGLLIPAKGLSILFGGNDRIGLWLAGLVLCFLFWAALLFFARRLGLSPLASLALAVTIGFHPAAFYLAVPYTEALFTLCALLFIRATVPGTVIHSVTGTAAGFWMTATRIVGVALAPLPLVRPLVEAWFGEPGAARRLARALLIAAIALGGVLSFFAYCEYKVGHWDAYIQTHRVTGNAFDWKRIFEGSRYSFPSGDPWHQPNRIGKWVMHAVMVVLLSMTPIALSQVLRLRRAGPAAGAHGARHLRHHGREMGMTASGAAALHLALFYAAWVLFLIPFLSVQNTSMWGIMRHSYPSYIFAVLNLFALAKGSGMGFRTGRLISLGLLPILLASAAMQFFLAGRFVAQHWVA